MPTYKVGVGKKYGPKAPFKPSARSERGLSVDILHDDDDKM